jgi:hypothetical protein
VEARYRGGAVTPGFWLAYSIASLGVTVAAGRAAWWWLRQQDAPRRPPMTWEIAHDMAEASAKLEIPRRDDPIVFPGMLRGLYDDVYRQNQMTSQQYFGGFSDRANDLNRNAQAFNHQLNNAFNMGAYRDVGPHPQTEGAQ